MALSPLSFWNAVKSARRVQEMCPEAADRAEVADPRAGRVGVVGPEPADALPRVPATRRPAWGTTNGFSHYAICGIDTIHDAITAKPKTARESWGISGWLLHESITGAEPGARQGE